MNKDTTEPGINQLFHDNQEEEADQGAKLNGDKGPELPTADNEEEALLLAIRHRVAGLEEDGKYLIGHCPVEDHADERPSFKYDRLTRQFKCWSHLPEPWGGRWPQWVKQFPEDTKFLKKKRGRPKKSEVYPELPASADHQYLYHDKAGQVIGAVCRWDRPGDKDIRTFTKVSAGWQGSKDWQSVPYHLHKLMEDPDRPIWIHEGEKVVEAVQPVLPEALHTTWPGGADSVLNCNWHYIRDRKVVLIADQDTQGRDAMKALAGRLVINHCEVCLVLPEGEDHNDLANAVEANWTGEQITEWVLENLEPYNPSPEVLAEIRLYDSRRERLKEQGIDYDSLPEQIKVLDHERVEQVLADQVMTLLPDLLDVYEQGWTDKYMGKYNYAKGKGWIKFDPSGIGVLVKPLYDRTEACKWTFRRMLQEVESAMKPNVPFSYQCDFDRNPRYIQFKDGDQGIDTTTGEVVDIPKEAKVLKRCNATGLEVGESTFSKVLERALPDQQTREAFQMVCGQALAGNPAQKMIQLLGKSGSGKSTIIHAITECLGAYMGGINKNFFFNDRMSQSQHPTAVQAFHGTRMVCIDQEIKSQDPLNHSMLHTVSGGGRLQGRGMRKDFGAIHCQVLLIFEGNSPIRLKWESGDRDSEEAFRRRIVGIPFNVPVPQKAENGSQEKTEIKEKLEKEANYILGWLVVGLQMYRESAKEHGANYIPMSAEMEDCNRRILTSGKQFLLAFEETTEACVGKTREEAYIEPIQLFDTLMELDTYKGLLPKDAADRTPRAKATWINARVRKCQELADRGVKVEKIGKGPKITAPEGIRIQEGLKEE